MRRLKFPYFYFFVWLLKKSKNLSALSCRLTQWTGKSKYPIHPKHLIKTEKPWYLKDIKSSDLVLDLGCSNGQHTIKTSKKCKKITGVDYDKFQLDIAKKSSQDKNLKNVQFIKLDLEKKFPFKNNSFNKVLALDILEHLNRRKHFLLEIKRVLKPHGIVFLAVPNKNTSWKKLQKKFGLNYYSDPDHKIEYSLNEIKKVLSQAGFRIINLRPIVFDTPLAGFVDLTGGISLRLYKKLSRWKRDKVKDSLKESIGFRIKVKK